MLDFYLFRYVDVTLLFWDIAVNLSVIAGLSLTVFTNYYWAQAGHLCVPRLMKQFTTRDKMAQQTSHS